MRNLKITLLFVVVLVFVAAFGLGIARQPADVAAAPRAAITPVAANDPLTGDASVLIKFFDGEVMTASDQECRDLREYRTVDLEYVVDQTVGNTATVTLEHTNGAGADLTVNTTGQAVVSGNTADADALNTFDLYGVYTCVDIALSASDPVTFTVYGLARR